MERARQYAAGLFIKGPLRRVLNLAASAVLLSAVVYCVLPIRIEDVLARSYGSALADAETSWSPRNAGHLWLSRLGEQPALLRRAVAVGDKITVGGLQHPDVFEVVALEQIDGTRLGHPSLQIQVVTARPEGMPHENEIRETVRFLFAVDNAPAVAPLTKAEKVL